MYLFREARYVCMMIVGYTAILLQKACELNLQAISHHIRLFLLLLFLNNGRVSFV